MFSFAFGMGALSGGFSSSYSGDEHSFRVTDPGISYSLRFATAASDTWLVLLAVDGTWADLSDRRLSSYDSWSSTTFTVGAQYFIRPWLYSRLGVGLGCLNWNSDDDDDDDDDSNCKGMAASGGVGMEFYQRHNSSIAVEVAGTIVRYTTYQDGSDDINDAWFSLGANLVLSFF